MTASRGFADEHSASGRGPDSISDIARSDLAGGGRVAEVQESVMKQKSNRLLKTRLLHDPRASMADSPLTERERQILRLIAEDRSNKEIAVSLRIGQKTVEFHRQSIKAKL